MSLGQHRRQVDCNNHEEVITELELKSKDLYYFWRNYEWLYNRYINEQQQPPQPQPQPQPNRAAIQKLNREIEDLESQNEQLISENRSLKREVQGLRVQVQDQSSVSKYEADYKKEMALLRSNYDELKKVNDQQQQEIMKLQRQLKQTEGEWDNERHRLTTENRTNVQRCIELQQSIDQLRHQPAPNPVVPKPSQGVSQHQVDELRRRQTALLSSQFKQLGEQAESMMHQECEALRRELEEKFADMLAEMSQRQLNSLIVEASQ